MDEALPNVARMREYVTPDGVRWHRRGDQILNGKFLGTRIGKSGVRVVHSSLGQLTTIPPDRRADFRAGAEERMAESAQSEFRGVELRNDSGDCLLVIEEYC
ncbi:MAG: hypothetical protein U0S36_06665 [Candidatus Nanopelagicales bacterium]